MNETNQPHEPTGGQSANAPEGADLKAVAIELFKKSQRLPPLSLILKKRKAKGLVMPPRGFEFADFYHL